ncbi:MAG: hypothetical protein ACLPX5_04310 [Dissulfurispiraceae bacterium]
MTKSFRIGAIVGGMLGVVVTLGMDIILGQKSGEGWSAAVAHDLNHLLDTQFSTNNIIVITGVLLIIGIIASVGALVGGFFSTLIARLFEVLTKED